MTWRLYNNIKDPVKRYRKKLVDVKSLDLTQRGGLKMFHSREILTTIEKWAC